MDEIDKLYKIKAKKIMTYTTENNNKFRIYVDPKIRQMVLSRKIPFTRIKMFGEILVSLYAEYEGNHLNNKGTLSKEFIRYVFDNPKFI